MGDWGTWRLGGSGGWEHSSSSTPAPHPPALKCRLARPSHRFPRATVCFHSKARGGMNKGWSARFIVSATEAHILHACCRIRPIPCSLPPPQVLTEGTLCYFKVSVFVVLLFTAPTADLLTLLHTWRTTSLLPIHLPSFQPLAHTTHAWESHYCYAADQAS